MNKFNIESAKFVIIIIGICFIFVMVIWHAFDYLPANDSNKTITDTTASMVKESNEEEAKEDSEEEANIDEHEIENSEQKEEASFKEQNLTPLESISDEKLGVNEIEQERSLDDVLNKAKEYTQENRASNAISEYQKAIKLTDDSKIKAQCYEEIALIYANQKRYGSALSVAQKAYNISPSTSHEVLLARLYYKTGDIDKATNRVNNILRRDFILNDK